jgi:hypothetical protein
LKIDFVCVIGTTLFQFSLKITPDSRFVLGSKAVGEPQRLWMGERMGELMGEHLMGELSKWQAWYWAIRLAIRWRLSPQHSAIRWVIRWRLVS